jgi:hypothetical protein
MSNQDKHNQAPHMQRGTRIEPRVVTPEVNLTPRAIFVRFFQVDFLVNFIRNSLWIKCRPFSRVRKNGSRLPRQLLHAQVALIVQVAAAGGALLRRLQTLEAGGAELGSVSWLRVCLHEQRFSRRSTSRGNERHQAALSDQIRSNPICVAVSHDTKIMPICRFV